MHALRNTMRLGLAQLTEEQIETERERMRLLESTPELRPRVMENYYNTIAMLAGWRPNGPVASPATWPCASGPARSSAW